MHGIPDTSDLELIGLRKIEGLRDGRKNVRNVQIANLQLKYGEWIEGNVRGKRRRMK